MPVHGQFRQGGYYLVIEGGPTRTRRLPPNYSWVAGFSEQIREEAQPAFGRIVLALLGFALAAGVFVPSHGARAAVSFVQSASSSNFLASIPVSFAANVKAQDVIAVSIVKGEEATILSSVTDNCGAGGGSNAYTILGPANFSFDTYPNSAMYLAYAVVGKSGACTVSALSLIHI